MTFHFKLEKLLHFVRMRESVKSLEVAAVAGRVGFIERRKDLVESSMRELLAQSHRVISPAWAVFQNARISSDAAEAGRLDKILFEERRLLEKRRHELSRILMRKKALESLREKRYAEHKMQESRKRQKQADEMHQIRTFFRKD